METHSEDFAVEMRLLCDLGRWLLSESTLKANWGEALWFEAFDACGSPTEWQEFKDHWNNHPATQELKAKFDQKEKALPPRGPWFHQPIELPSF